MSIFQLIFLLLLIDKRDAMAFSFLIEGIFDYLCGIISNLLCIYSYIVNCMIVSLMVNFVK
jgi:hypothetical protein